jgi:hypothetical protein
MVGGILAWAWGRASLWKNVGAGIETDTSGDHRVVAAILAQVAMQETPRRWPETMLPARSRRKIGGFADFFALPPLGMRAVCPKVRLPQL